MSRALPQTPDMALSVPLRRGFLHEGLWACHLLLPFSNLQGNKKSRVSLTGSPVELFPGITLPFPVIVPWGKMLPFTIFHKKANGIQHSVSSRLRWVLWEASVRHPSAYSSALAASPGVTLLRPHTFCIQHSCHVTVHGHAVAELVGWSTSPVVSVVESRPGGPAGLPQHTLPLTTITSPRAEIRETAEIWCPETVTNFLARLFGLACTCFLYVCSVHYWLVVFSESRQRISFNKQSSKRRDLTRTFIHLSISSLGSPYAGLGPVVGAGNTHK